MWLHLHAVFIVNTDIAKSPKFERLEKVKDSYPEDRMLVKPTRVLQTFFIADKNDTAEEVIFVLYQLPVLYIYEATEWFRHASS